MVTSYDQKNTRGVLVVPVVLVVLVVFEVPGPEIRILQEISSPELAGNRRKTRFRSVPKPTRGILMVPVVLVVSWVLGGSWP